MYKKFQLGFVVLSLLTALFFVGCLEDGGTPETPTPTPTPIPTPTPTPVTYGNFQLLVSDAPADIGDFTSLVVTFNHTRIFKTGEYDSEAGFEIRALNHAQADLTELVGEKALPILNTSLEAGRYSKIELQVEKVEAVLSSTETAVVKVPSEKLQIVKPFEIAPNKTTRFVFDINVVRKGHSNEYNLLPVISKSGVVDEDVGDVEKVEPEEEEEKEIEIEVKIEDNVAIVRIELNETERELTINTTDRAEIVAEIINVTGLTSEQIEQYIEFDNEV
jgi:hypothetical protein